MNSPSKLWTPTRFLQRPEGPQNPPPYKSSHDWFSAAEFSWIKSCEWGFTYQGLRSSRTHCCHRAISFVHSFIKSQVDRPHMFTIKVQVIRNTAHRPSTQASYTIGSGTTMQEIQPAAQIAAKHSIFSQMAPYMSRIYMCPSRDTRHSHL